MELLPQDVMKSLRPAGALYSAGRFEQALAEVSSLWGSLPGDKTDVPNAYLIVEYAVAFLLKLGRLQEARTWAESGLAFRQVRRDGGEAEFLIAKVAYEQGAMNDARWFLEIAHRKSEGRVLEGADPKYLAILKAK